MGRSEASKQQQRDRFVRWYQEKRQDPEWMKARSAREAVREKERVLADPEYRRRRTANERLRRRARRASQSPAEREVARATDTIRARARYHRQHPQARHNCSIDLPTVARLYLEGGHEAVRDAQGVAFSTARNYVYRARAAGLLPPVKRGGHAAGADPR